jgi:hypothetical protein
MKQYQLGPNGGIMTALNLFATKFDQVMDLVDKKADELKHVFIDTPGQIEVQNPQTLNPKPSSTCSSTHPARSRCRIRKP